MVSAGSRHTCGVTPSGVAYCWGDNSSGQLGNGTTTNSATPVPVSGALSFASVSAGGNHTCGATSARVAYCWGDNSSGQLGNGTLTNSSVAVAIPSIGVSSSLLSVGSNHTCADVLIGGFDVIRLVDCWGDNSSGQLGNGTRTNSAVPVGVFTNYPQAVFLSAGTLYSCALSATSLVSSVVFCWGNNGAGQLGNGTMTNSAIPVSISGGLNFASMSAGALHACGPVKNSSANGTVFSYAYCWSDNSFGQPGKGTTTNSAIPIVVAGGLNFAAVSAGGGRHTCGVIGIASYLPSSPTAAGAVYCWGDNAFGQLGNSWTTSGPVPVNVAGQS